MLRNNNSAIIKKLVNKNFKANKVRNLMLIISIGIITFLFTFIYSTAASIMYSIYDQNILSLGSDDHIIFENITSEEAAKLASHPFVTEWGASITLGIAENPTLAYRTSRICYGDDTYIMSNLSAPLQGRSPIKKNEIAIDTASLDSLNIAHNLGETVTLKWRKDITSSQYEETEFTICGIWEGFHITMTPEILVSEKFAAEQLDGINEIYQKNSGQIFGLQTLGVKIYDASNLNKKAAQMLIDTELEDIDYILSSIQINNFFLISLPDTMPLILGSLLVFLAGYLIIYNIFHISIISDIQYYGKLKTLGTSPKQIHSIVRSQANRLCILGIPAGLIPGFLFSCIALPYILQTYVKLKGSFIILLIAITLSYITVFLSLNRAARIAEKISPMEAVNYTGAALHSRSRRKNKTKTVSSDSNPMHHKKRSINRKTANKRKNLSLQLALANITRNKSRLFITICSLSLSFIISCLVHSITKSANPDIYLKEMQLADFEVFDISLDDYYGHYNAAIDSVPQDLTAQILNLDGLLSYGTLYSQEVLISLTSEVYQRNIDYFEANDKEALKYMARDKFWTDSYYKMRGTQTCHVTLFGVDGIIIDELIKEDNLIDGAFYPDKFATGSYALIHGYSDPADPDPQTVEPVYHTGETINIDGQSLEIMNIISSPSSIQQGDGSPEAAFCLYVYIPADKFLELYPNTNIRKFYFNMEPSHSETAERLLSDYKNTAAPTFTYTSEAYYLENFNGSIRSQMTVLYIIAATLFIIGLLNYINASITTLLTRQQEFAAMQHLGMTKKQLLKFIIRENLLYIALILIISTPLTFITVIISMHLYTATQWTMNFTLSLLPLFISVPILLVLALLIPAATLRITEQTTITNRLRPPEETPR